MECKWSVRVVVQVVSACSVERVANHLQVVLRGAGRDRTTFASGPRKWSTSGLSDFATMTAVLVAFVSVAGYVAFELFSHFATIVHVVMETIAAHSPPPAAASEPAPTSPPVAMPKSSAATVQAAAVLAALRAGVASCEVTRGGTERAQTHRPARSGRLRRC